MTSLSLGIRDYLLSNDKFKNNLLVNWLYILYSFIKILIRNGFRYTSIEKLIRRRSSDILVILGAGSSLAKLSEGQLCELGSHDLAGLSYSCSLPVRQKFYFYECPQLSESRLIQEHIDKILPNAKEASEENRIDNLIWKNSEKKRLREKVNLDEFSTPIVCSILSDDADIVARIFRLHRRSGLMKYFLLQKRGSVSALLQFGLGSNYDSIIFAGIDLNSNGYFFEQPEYRDVLDYENPFELESGSESGSVHATNDPKLGLPIEQVLEKICASSPETQFFVTSSDSALSSWLPVWKWRL